MESNWDQTIESFDELGLKKDLLRGKQNQNIIFKVFTDMDLKSPHQFRLKPFSPSSKEETQLPKPSLELVKRPPLPLVLYKLLIRISMKYRRSFLLPLENSPNKSQLFINSSEST
jgi:hypothetical protein